MNARRFIPVITLRCKKACAYEARSAEIGLHEPSLIENRPVESCIAKFGLVEPRATQNRAGKIKTGKIETRELLAREIDRLKGGCGSDGSLDVCARHFRRCHLRRRQIDVLHHALGGSGNGGGKTEHRYCTNPDRSAYHRLTLPHCSNDNFFSSLPDASWSL